MNSHTRARPPGAPDDTKGKLVTFYKNGDKFFKGLTTSVSLRQFPNNPIPEKPGDPRYLYTLYLWLSEKLNTPRGVQHVFHLPDCREILRVEEFQTGEQYVAASENYVKKVDYGNVNGTWWCNRAPSAGRLRKHETGLYDGQHARSRSYPGSRTSGHVPLGVTGRPRVLIFISNTVRSSTQKVMLNPRTTQTFEEMLHDVQQVVKLQYPPCTGIFAFKPPYVKVEGFSHLLKKLKTVDKFLVVGQEMIPAELSPGQRSIQQHQRPRQQQYKQFQQQQQQTGYSPRQGYQQPAYMSPRQPHGALVLNGDAQNDRYSFHGTPVPPYDDYQSKRGRRKGKPRTKPVDQVLNGYDDSPRSHAAPPYSRREDLSPPRDFLSQDVDEDYSRVTESSPVSHPQDSYRHPEDEQRIAKVDIHGHPREFHAPQNAPLEGDSRKPRKRLKLDWVYGYRGRDARNNLHVLPSGDLLYYVAAVAVVFDRRREKQFHYLGHTEDITCMTVHPSRTNPCVATGQTCGKLPGNGAHIRIWDPHSLETKVVLGMNVFQGGVSSLGFSNVSGELEDGSLLVAVDEGDKHTMSIWHWQKPSDQLLAKTTTSADTVVWSAFHPLDHSILVTYGKQHVYFWKLYWDPKNNAPGKIYRDTKSGLFMDDVVPKFVTSMTFARNGDVISGDSNGDIIVWTRDLENAFIVDHETSNRLKHAHGKSVFSLCLLDDDTLLSGGGNEIKAWDSLRQYKPVKDRLIPETSGAIRTIVAQTQTGSDGTLLIGTTHNLILEGSMQDKFNTIVQGHREELWGVACSPRDSVFVTAGLDCTVAQWHTLRHKQLWRILVEKPCVSLNYDPKSRAVVAGTTDGRLIILNANSGRHMSSVQITNDKISVVSFSPDGNLLAVGSHDCNIYIYEVLDDCEVLRKYRTCSLSAHKNFVSHVDWSSDGRFLQSVSGDYDLLFWDIDSMKEILAEVVKDVKWATQTCTLGFNVLGAWSHLRDGGDIISIDADTRSNDLLAVGDNYGAIRLYRYPCISHKPGFQEQKRYSGSVSKVRFTYDGGYLISSGGSDAGVLQWTVIDDPEHP